MSMRIFELLFLNGKEIPKIGKNGTKLTIKSFNSKLAPRNFLKLGLKLHLTLLNTTVKYEYENF